jgi:hypothetical protein
VGIDHPGDDLGNSEPPSVTSTMGAPQVQT